MIVVEEYIHKHLRNFKIMNDEKFDHLEISEKLCELIRDDGFDIGDRFPTVLEVANQYNVCRNTAMRAIFKLVGEGTLELKRGHGICIKEMPK